LLTIDGTSGAIVFEDEFRKPAKTDLSGLSE